MFYITGYFILIKFLSLLYLAVGSKIGDLTSSLLSSIGMIELQTEMYCDLKFISFSKSIMDKIDWKVILSHQKPYEVIVNSTVLKIKTPYSSRNFSLCQNIIILLPIDQPELSDASIFFSKITQFGKPSQDRYFLVSPSKETLESLWSVRSQEFKKIKMKAGIFLDSSTTKPKFLVEPKVYTEGLMIEQSQPPLLYRLMDNLNGRQFLVTTSNLSPYLMIENGTKLSGVHYNLLKSITTSRNCSMLIDLQNIKKSTGIPLANGTWTGMMGDVIHGDADIAAMMGINEIRHSANIDFTQFVLQDVMIFATKHPTFVVKWEALFYPFTLQLWALVIFTFILFLPLFFASIHISEGIGYTRRYGEDKWLKLKKHIYEAFMIPFSLSLEQSVESLDASKKKQYITKCIVVLWLTFTIITGIAYKSNLVGFLSFPKAEEIPRTFHDLHVHQDYKLTLNYAGGAGILLFKSSTSKMYKSITKRLVLEKDIHACITSAIIEKKSVCIQWYLVLHSAIAKEFTVNLYIDPMFISHKDPAGFIFVGIGLKKNSIYTEYISNLLSRLRDTGHVQKWIKEVLMSDKIHGKAQFAKSSNSSIYETVNEVMNEILEENSVRPMKMKNLLCVFMIYIIGFIGAMIAFQFEIKLCRNVFKLKRTQTLVSPFN